MEDIESKCNQSSSSSYSLNQINTTLNCSTNIQQQSQSQNVSSVEFCQLKSYDLPNLLPFSWLAPLAISLLLPSLCFGVYFSALYQDQIEPILPYVSDAGTNTPQAEFFAQGLDILAILVCLTTIARYKQLAFFIQTSQSSIPAIALHNRLAKLNRIALFVALVGAFFMSMAGNFRTSEANDVHCAAASSMLICMLAYGSLMTAISYKLATKNDGNHIETLPTTMGVTILVGIVSFVFCICASLTSFGLFGIDNFYNNQARLNWKDGEPGYGWHVICTTLEWVTINIFAIVYLCLARRMKQFTDWDKV